MQFEDGFSKLSISKNALLTRWNPTASRNYFPQSCDNEMLKWREKNTNIPFWTKASLMRLFYHKIANWKMTNFTEAAVLRNSLLKLIGKVCNSQLSGILKFFKKAKNLLLTIILQHVMSVTWRIDIYLVVPPTANMK